MALTKTYFALSMTGQKPHNTNYSSGINTED